MATAMVQVNVRITPELHAAIEEVARCGNASVSDVIRKAIRDYVLTREGKK